MEEANQSKRRHVSSGGAPPLSSDEKSNNSDGKSSEQDDASLKSELCAGDVLTLRTFICRLLGSFLRKRRDDTENHLFITSDDRTCVLLRRLYLFNELQPIVSWHTTSADRPDVTGFYAFQVSVGDVVQMARDNLHRLVNEDGAVCLPNEFEGGSRVTVGDGRLFRLLSEIFRKVSAHMQTHEEMALAMGVPIKKLGLSEQNAQAVRTLLEADGDGAAFSDLVHTDGVRFSHAFELASRLIGQLGTEPNTMRLLRSILVTQTLLLPDISDLVLSHLLFDPLDG